MMNISHISPLSRQHLSDRAKQALISLIREYGKNGKPFTLPNEEKLATRLGMSRNVLRDALASLEEQGLVTRQRGRGTIASPAVANTTCRVDTEPTLSLMLQRAGFSATVKTLSVSIDPTCTPNSDGILLNLVSKRLFYADNIPVIYVEDYFENRAALDANSLIKLLQDLDHKEFLENIYTIVYAYTMVHVRAVLAQPWLAELFNIEPSSPVLQMEDYGYDVEHRLILHSMGYYRGDILDLKFLRKNL